MRIDQSTLSQPWHGMPMPARMKMRRAVRPLLFRLWHPLLIRWNRKPRRARIGDLALCTDPQVFHPGQHFSSKVLAAHVAGLNLHGCRLLDMGTGSGIIGLTAAQKGAQVVAVDINPAAAALANRNARESGAGHVMRVLCGDLVAPLAPAVKFEWIVFNPPFYPRRPQQALELAFNAGHEYETIARFLQQAKNFLAPACKIVMILSSDMELAVLQKLFERFQYQIAGCEITPHTFEFFYIVHLIVPNR